MLPTAELWNRVVREIPRGIPCSMTPLSHGSGKDRWLFRAGTLKTGPGKFEEVIEEGLALARKHRFNVYPQLAVHVTHVPTLEVRKKSEQSPAPAPASPPVKNRKQKLMQWRLF